MNGWHAGRARAAVLHLNCRDACISTHAGPAAKRQTVCLFAPSDVLVGLAGVNSPLQQHLQHRLILGFNSLRVGG